MRRRKEGGSDKIFGQNDARKEEEIRFLAKNFDFIK